MPSVPSRRRLAVSAGGQAAPALHLDVYRNLKVAILSGELKPGQVISEAELSRHWEVSRTPIREALRRLEQEHLVKWSPRRGAVVAPVTVAGIRDLYEVRESLEGLAAQLASQRASDDEVADLASLATAVREAHGSGELLKAMRLDDQLHRRLARVTRNQVLRTSADPLLDRVLVARMMVRKDPGRLDEIAAEHDRIVNALRERDATAAEAEARQHVRRARLRLMEMLQRSSVDDGGSWDETNL